MNLEKASTYVSVGNCFQGKRRKCSHRKAGWLNGEENTVPTGRLRVSRQLERHKVTEGAGKGPFTNMETETKAGSAVLTPDSVASRSLQRPLQPRSLGICPQKPNNRL